MGEGFVLNIGAQKNDRHFADDVFQCILLNDSISVSIDISLKFVPKGQIKNILALVQIMAWDQLDDKPLFEPMIVNCADACMRHSASIC